MPVYTYRCENCGIQFDQTQKFADDPLTTCPECKKKTLHKVYTPVGIVFKGSGFYATDHRSPSGMNYSSKNEERNAEEKKESAKPAETSKATPAAPAASTENSK